MAAIGAVGVGEECELFVIGVFPSRFECSRIPGRKQAREHPVVDRSGGLEGAVPEPHGVAVGRPSGEGAPALVIECPRQRSMHLVPK
jgi:hypothetical protein